MDHRSSVALFVLGLGMLSQLVSAADTHYPMSSDDDWAYELSNSAKDIYLKKTATVSCAMLGELIGKNQSLAASIAIRDAALFGNRECAQEIQKNSAKLMNDEATRLTVLFYRSQFGDAEAKKALIHNYDLEITKRADYPAVELFGYMSDWDQTGRRLARLADRADGSAAEALCSALTWRRFLYGEVPFATVWYQIGSEEKISKEKLDRYFYRCHS